MQARHTNAAGVTAGQATLRQSPPARRRTLRSFSWRTHLVMKLGSAGLALAVLIEVAGLCLCAPRPSTSRDPHACCPRPSAGQHDSSGAAATLSTAGHGADCCPQLRAPASVRLDERDPLPVSVAYQTARVETAADSAISFVAAVTVPGRASSPPRSPVLRI